MAKNTPLCLDTFVKGKLQGLSHAKAYVAAGGTAKNTAVAGYQYYKKASTQKALKAVTEESALDSMAILTTLTPLALNHYRELLLSDDPKDKRAKDKVAGDVIARTRDILPKEIKTTHEVSIDEESQDAIESIADFLLSQGGGGRVIEAIESKRTQIPQENDGEEGITTEYVVCASQETETSS